MVASKYVEDCAILIAMERLAAQRPWDTIDIWISRRPEGEMSYTAYIHDNTKMGWQSVFGHGNNVEEACKDALIKSAGRDPEEARKAKLAELREQIRKLEAVVIGCPPYVPNRELLERNPVVDIN